MWRRGRCSPPSVPVGKVCSGGFKRSRLREAEREAGGCSRLTGLRRCRQPPPCAADRFIPALHIAPPGERAPAGNGLPAPPLGLPAAPEGKPPHTGTEAPAVPSPPLLPAPSCPFAAAQAGGRRRRGWAAEDARGLGAAELPGPAPHPRARRPPAPAACSSLSEAARGKRGEMNGTSGARGRTDLLHAASIRDLGEDGEEPGSRRQL